MTSPRSADQRKRDTLHRLANDVDAWVATADSTGTPYLVPLSFLWEGGEILVSTPTDSPTGRNFASGKVRLGIGLTRDVVVVEGSVEVAILDDAAKQRFAAKAGFDPSRLAGYGYYRIRPRLMQAWREADELNGRVLMRDGEWLTP